MQQYSVGISICYSHSSSLHRNWFKERPRNAFACAIVDLPCRQLFVIQELNFHSNGLYTRSCPAFICWIGHLTHMQKKKNNTTLRQDSEKMMIIQIFSFLHEKNVYRSQITIFREPEFNHSILNITSRQFCSMSAVILDLAVAINLFNFNRRRTGHVQIEHEFFFLALSAIFVCSYF